jgi:glycerophosphoryl diester phosphodiesterase
MYPEQTYLAYDESVRNGDVLLEGDVATLGDGSLALMHDTTVERTTTATGNLGSYTATTWSALRVDGNAWHGSNYGNDLNVPLFRDWIQKYRSKGIFVPEDKDGRSMKPMLQVFDELKLNRDKVLLQCFSMAPLQVALAAGYQACFLNNNAITSIATVQASGVGWVGLPMSPPAELKKWTDSGLKVLVWTINRRFYREEALAVGVRGFFSDDPAYLKANTRLFTTDQFASGNWLPGMLGNGSDSSRELRGEFFSGGFWGYRSPTPGYMSCLHGYLCPIIPSANARQFTIDLNVTFDEALANDGSRYASVFLGPDDRPFLEGGEWSAGYNLILRKNGSAEIHKKAFGIKAALLRATTGIPISDGELVRYRIAVTPSAISLTRLNTDGSNGASVTALDNSFHGVYIHLGRNGLACRFSGISVKPDAQGGA